ncbi:MAG TPA: patatin-like phospholipase family protein [Gammaproteobacteria bacterium]|jgi:NTE family protein|nr:patatin-like phospholipase family protein [Gammaproteobacteria bacterium]
MPSDSKYGQFRNLVFEGGGVKGIAYAGAIQALEEAGILPNILRVAGTSAGAITAVLLSLGAGSKDVAAIVGGTDFHQFMDAGFPLSAPLRLVRDYGWYKGDAFADWIKAIIKRYAKDGGLTFAGLRKLRAQGGNSFRELYMVGTDLCTQQPLVFSAEDTPDVPIWSATRTSMSIPLFFQAVRVGKDVRVDGGVSWNYPLDLFDDKKYLDDKRAGVKPDYPTVYDADQVYNKETLGFRVDTSDEIAAEKASWKLPPADINNVADYIKALVGFMTDIANKAHLHENDWHRTVFIDAAGVSATDFGLSQAEVRTLVANGLKGARDYLAWFADPKPAVKPRNLKSPAEPKARGRVS